MIHNIEIKLLLGQIFKTEAGHRTLNVTNYPNKAKKDKDKK